MNNKYAFFGFIISIAPIVYFIISWILFSIFGSEIIPIDESYPVFYFYLISGLVAISLSITALKLKRLVPRKILSISGIIFSVIDFLLALFILATILF